MWELSDDVIDICWHDYCYYWFEKGVTTVNKSKLTIEFKLEVKSKMCCKKRRY